MGRYTTTDLITFTNYNGKTFQVRDIRLIPEYTTLIKYQYQQNEFFDEIMSRPEYYGDGNENLAYAMTEANKEVIVENNFDLTTVRELIIPVVEV